MKWPQITFTVRPLLHRALSFAAALRCLAALLPLDLLHWAQFVSGSGTVANGLKGAFTQGTVSPAGGLVPKRAQRWRKLAHGPNLPCTAKLTPANVKMPVEINWIQLTAPRGSAAPRCAAAKQHPTQWPLKIVSSRDLVPWVKARYGGSNMKKISNGCRLLIFYMMEGIKKVNWKNGILWLFSVTDPLKSKMAAKFRWKTGWPGNARTQLLRMIAMKLKQF